MEFVIYFALLLGLPFLAICLCVWAFCKLTGRECPFEW